MTLWKDSRKRSWFKPLDMFYRWQDRRNARKQWEGLRKQVQSPSAKALTREELMELRKQLMAHSTDPLMFNDDPREYDLQFISRFDYIPKIKDPRVDIPPPTA